jgi:transcriptional regulator with XRE-family HTH domain
MGTLDIKMERRHTGTLCYTGHMALPTLAELVGASVRRHREERELSQDQLARRCRQAGLSWSRSTLTDVEAGKKDLKLAEALVLAHVLECPVAELLEGEAVWVQVTPGLGGSSSGLRALVRGGEDFWARDTTLDQMAPRRLLRALTPEEQARLSRLAPNLSEDTIEETLATPRGEAEQKAARRLGVTPAEVAVVSCYLWARSLTEERERLLQETEEADAPRRSLRGFRAHLTRALVADLARRFAEVEDGRLVPDPLDQDLVVVAPGLAAAIQESARSAATPDAEGPGNRQAKSVRSVLPTGEPMTVTDNAGGQPMLPATIRTEEGKNDGR